VEGENRISKKGGRGKKGGGAMAPGCVGVYGTSEKQEEGREEHKLCIVYIALESGLSKAG
jgi:hypothetical protein